MAGLWPMLHTAGEKVNLVELGKDGFLKPHIRGFRLGVDASIWLHHVKSMDADIEKYGIHAGARTLMYRILTYLRRGFLLYFVFDGAQRPKQKRGRVRCFSIRTTRLFLMLTRHEAQQYIAGGTSSAEIELQGLLDIMGCGYRTAPGEAEYELASMARLDLIDGILTVGIQT